MTNLIMDTDKALYEALGHLIQAEILTGGVATQDHESYELSDTRTLLADAITQLRGELLNREDAKRGAA